MWCFLPQHSGGNPRTSWFRQGLQRTKPIRARQVTSPSMTWIKTEYTKVCLRNTDEKLTVPESDVKLLPVWVMPILSANTTRKRQNICHVNKETALLHKCNIIYIQYLAHKCILKSKTSDVVPKNGLKGWVLVYIKFLYFYIYSFQSNRRWVFTSTEFSCSLTHCIFSASLVAWANWSMAEAADVSCNAGESGVFLMVLVSAEADLLAVDVAFILCTSSWETVWYSMTKS